MNICRYVFYAYIRVCMHLCVYACMFICMHVCIHVCIYVILSWILSGTGVIVLVGRGNCPGEFSGGNCPGNCPGELSGGKRPFPMAGVDVHTYVYKSRLIRYRPTNLASVRSVYYSWLFRLD